MKFKSSGGNQSGKQHFEMYIRNHDNRARPKVCRPKGDNNSRVDV